MATLKEWGQEQDQEGAFDEWCWVNIVYPYMADIYDPDSVEFEDFDGRAFKTRYDSDVFKHDAYVDFDNELWTAEVLYAEQLENDKGYLDWYVVAAQ